jgi:hypothetical protein
VVVVVSLFLFGGLPLAGVGMASLSSAPALGLRAPTGGVPARAFAFVSNFEDLALDGWHATRGTASVTALVNYEGEPSLRSTAAGSRVQVDTAQSGFVLGDAAISFQAEFDYASGGTGFIGLAHGGAPLAVVGVGGGSVLAGPTPSLATMVMTIPTTGTAQPAGWVDLMVSAFAVNPKHPTTSAWLMNVYVDRTDSIAATNLSVPGAGNYSGGIIETTHGSVDLTNVVFSTYTIPTTIPGYNNMDGYGQGSDLLVSVLPAFTTLSAQMTLTSWNTPQRGILSFQINAMNWTGTVRPTCHGFFQLGVDLDPHGRIAPWYVPGKNCVAYYFATNSSRVAPGFPTPLGSRLDLKITDDVATRTIDFSIVDLSVLGANRTSSTSIPYSGSEFFGTYTQVEWQPCCSLYPISSYFLNGSLAHLHVSGGNFTGPTPLPASYMLPYALDLPPSWNLGYYAVSYSGYSQVG